MSALRSIPPASDGRPHKGHVRVHILGSEHAHATVRCLVGYSGDGRLCSVQLLGSTEWIVTPVLAVDFDACIDCGSRDNVEGASRCHACAMDARAVGR